MKRLNKWDKSSFTDGCDVEEESKTYLISTAELLGIEVTDLRKHLVSRLIQPTRGGTKGTLYSLVLMIKIDYFQLKTFLSFASDDLSAF